MKQASGIAFTKMHGLGNDFMVVNAMTEPFPLQKISLPQLADRHVGVGFDQLLVLEPSEHAVAFCRIYNSDGSEAEQCGNGLRCVARFLQEEGICTQSSFAIETKAGVFPVTIHDYDHIQVTLGTPRVQESLVPIEITSQTAPIPISIISTGNPHAILKVDNVAAINTHQLGTSISSNRLFPHGANVGFMQIVDTSHVRLRTYERGAGETNACGSNACAAAVAGIVNQWLKESVQVEYRLGSLLIQWEGEGKPIHMTGPAVRIYRGQFNIAE